MHPMRGLWLITFSFCRSTKTLYDVCSDDGASDDCFDTETLAVRGLKRSVSYNWKKVEKWGPEVSTAMNIDTVQL